jgi:hypothetical protein
MNSLNAFQVASHSSETNCKLQETVFGGMSVLTKNTRRKIPEDGFLHSHRRENLKSYKLQIVAKIDMTRIFYVLPLHRNLRIISGFSFTGISAHLYVYLVVCHVQFSVTVHQFDL